MIKKELKFLRIFLVFIFIFTLSFADSAVNLDDLHLNIQTTDGVGKVVTGTFNFEFNISTSNSCTPVVYSKSTSLTTDSRGIVSYYLNNVSLDYLNQYYLCYYRDGSLIETAEIARSPYAFRAKYVDLGGVEVTQNFDLGNYNMTATSFFGDGSGLTNLNASSVNYWLKNNTDLYYNNGNVGIGISIPGSLFHIKKNSANGYVANNMIIDGSTQSTVVDGSGQVISFKGNSNRFWGAIGGYTANSKEGIGIFAGLSTSLPSTPQLYVNSDGSVGIGTTSPSGKLHVKSASAGIVTPNPVADDFVIENSGDGGMTILTPDASTSYFEFGSPSDSTGAYMKWNYNNKLLSIGTSSSTTDDIAFNTYKSDEVMRIDQDGNVGIGTTTPTNKLEINASNGEGLTIKTYSDSYDPTINLGRLSSNNFRFQVRGTGSSSWLGIYDTVNGIVDQGLNIKSNGYVGINTTNPSSNLEVVGTVQATSFIGDGSGLTGISGKLNSTGWNKSGTDVYLANSGNNVGIGTDVPTSKLQIEKSFIYGPYGPESSNLYLVNKNFEGSSGVLKLGSYYGNGGVNDYYVSSGIGGGKTTSPGSGWGGYMSFWTTSNGANGEAASGMYERIRISDSGKVGIGTTTPSQKLEVTGNVNITQNITISGMTIYKDTSGDIVFRA